MVKSVAARKSKSRKPRRRTARNRKQSLFPPIIPFNKVFLNVVLRHVSQYAQQPLNSTLPGVLTTKNVFDGMWSKLRDCFSQVWITKVHIYAMAGVGFEEPGYHLINVAPNKEFEINDKTTFSTMASLPGTRVSRITTMVSGAWHPTGMDERVWHKTDSDTVIMEYVYRSSCQKSDGKASASYPLELTIDCHVKLRGVNYSVLRSKHIATGVEESEGLEADFVNLAT